MMKFALHCRIDLYGSENYNNNVDFEIIQRNK